MCTYGIGLPFDHPIWQSLPPCRCGGPAPTPSLWREVISWDEPSPNIERIPARCPDCRTWFVDEHRCQTVTPRAHDLNSDCWCEPEVQQVPDT